MEHVDVVIIGAGAAGLMAAIAAGRSAPTRRVILLDGARTIGAKILVAGGGRCNVTHHIVDPRDYNGSTRNAIRKVLKQFNVAQTIAFFAALGVELKREETGKLFPVTDSAKTVLNALLGAVCDAGVELRHPYRVETVDRTADGFVVGGAWGSFTARRVVLATGGKSLPKTGSDGHGYAIARSLGHTVTPRVFPALVPLTMPPEHFICSLSGITLPATLTLQSASGRHLVQFTGSTLCTHFGLSGPSVLDLSRHWVNAKIDDPDCRLVINWLPQFTAVDVDRLLLDCGSRSVAKLLSEYLPQRLVEAMCGQAGVVPTTPGHQLSRDGRKMLVRSLTELLVPVGGHRGYRFAEVTAGGVPLSEIDLNSMQSRCCEGLHLVGEICDVDGRIGGFNFQWAWSSGYVAGRALSSHWRDGSQASD